jgi:hypothetical protein
VWGEDGYNRRNLVAFHPAAVEVIDIMQPNPAQLAIKVE